jgi:nucleotide-binding universal stress UspA family protein
MSFLSSSSASKRPCIIWAIDPFEMVSEPVAANVRYLANWVSNFNIEIQPTYVLSTSLRRVDEAASITRSQAKEALTFYLDGLKIKNLRAPKIIVTTEKSREQSIKLLLAFANDSGALLVAASSHGRSGLERLVYGSFAEEILKEAAIPTLFLTHFTSPLQESTILPSVLFPTDFTTKSKNAFGLLVGFAKTTGCEVTILHTLLYPIAATIGEGVCMPDNYLKDTEIWATEQSRTLIEFASEHGVQAHFLIKDGGIGVMSGKPILEVVGSAAYEALRADRFPVLIYGPNAVAGAPAMKNGPRAKAG